ncbi:biopolymer transporter ExbD [Parvibaculum sp.]|uniref:ExbD/TolR family protein n=1 Tax=Parvibaculum sp. TaxID=2024848 RepID=UPI000C96F221|nr:biopolymer transporter ExbD [Parvibaculum sp.]MAB13825.1 biopolymer transporter ExbD [Parvibaculum sp.]
MADAFDVPVKRRRMMSLTPLIDVVFQLLIFFMLTTSFLQTQALSVVTPAADQKELPEDARVVEIWLMGDGSLRVDGDPVSSAGLADAVRARIGERTDMTVTILAERDSRTQQLVRAVEAAREAGATNVGTARVERLGK